MGIDVYMYWKGMTEEEQKARYTGFQTDAGHIGYLREAYHGGPYATYALVPEAFQDREHAERWLGQSLESCGIRNYIENPETSKGDNEDDDEGHYVRIPADVMAARLEITCGIVITRAKKVYDEDLTPDDPSVQAFVNFVKLAKHKEDEGHKVYVYASY